MVFGSIYNKPNIHQNNVPIMRKVEMAISRLFYKLRKKNILLCAGVSKVEIAKLAVNSLQTFQCMFIDGFW